MVQVIINAERHISIRDIDHVVLVERSLESVIYHLQMSRCADCEVILLRKDAARLLRLVEEDDHAEESLDLREEVGHRPVRQHLVDQYGLCG